MRRPARYAVLSACLLLGAAWIPARAQSSATKAAETGEYEPATRSEGKAEGVSAFWAWANFAILVGALGYLIAKKGGPWFASRSLAIRKEIADAEEIRLSAQARAAEVDRKLAGLQADMETLRAEVRREQAAETERVQKQTEADMERIQEHAASEIDAAGKAARLELKRYAAQLAIDLAEQKIRRQMTPELQAALVENFERNLDQPAAGSHLNK
jgi:F-type H+-transporting ATPase subunit b